MSTAFAAAEQRLGQVTAALLANATLTEGDLELDGVLDEVDVIPPIGSTPMQGQRSQFVFETALAEGAVFAEGDAVSVAYRGVAQSYTVAQVTDLRQVGQTVLDLRKA